MSRVDNSRREAAFAVARWLATGAFAAEIIPDSPHRAFVQDLVYTVIRRLRPLRFVLGKLLKTWPKGELEALLYVGAAQILYKPEIPDFAAVHETVEAAKASRPESVARVVNATLRSLLRERESLEALLAQESVDVRESCPRALYRRWVARFGEEKAALFAQRNNEPAQTFLAFPDGSYKRLEHGVRVADVEGFGEGAFIVQNPATREALSFFEGKAPLRVLDACAAPGGKTVRLAWMGHKVTACEVNPKRRARLIDNLVRTKLDKAVEVVSTLESLQGRRFDGILVDAPCSNTGVLRRRVDARWNWSVEKLNAVVALQREILDATVPLLEDGGFLVYSTCSNEAEENEGQARDFLTRHPAFQLLQAREAFPFDDHGEEFWDGAYAAVFTNERKG